MLELDKTIRQIVLDSRVDATDGLFVPIVGERSDGHDYIEMAIANGARAVLSQRPVAALAEKYPKVRFYEVADTKAALQEIGLCERRKFTGKVVGVTGSVGKTTTRNMIACALSAGASVFQTAGNANSQVGVPITMFQMSRSGAELAVVELGMSEVGEMTRIAKVACVDIAVMTNIGVAHIGQLGSQENILREKLHILDGMPDGGILYLNGDDPMLAKVDLARIHSFGIAKDKHIDVRYYRKGDYALKLSVAGEHMLENAMAAMHVAETLGVPLDKAAQALSCFSGVKGRGAVHEVGGLSIIDDSYNASPDSMRASLRVLSEKAGARRIAVLADMKELGEKEVAYHAELGAFINQLNIDELFLLGDLAKELGAKAEKAKVHCFSDKGALLEALKESCHAGDVVLFKGSYSMGLSAVMQAFLEAKQKA